MADDNVRGNQQELNIGPTLGALVGFGVFAYFMIRWLQSGV